MGRSIPGLVGLANEPKPWDATLPAPVLKVPLGFCSPNAVWPKPKLLEPVLPNRPAPPGWPKPPGEAAWLAAPPKGFLFAASSLGFPPKPLKNPPPPPLPLPTPPPVPAGLDPNRLPPLGGCWPNMLAPLLGCWPNTEVEEELPNAEGWLKLKPVEAVVVVLLPNTGACPNPGLGCPKAGAALCPKSPVPPDTLPDPKEKELAVLAAGVPKRPPPPPATVVVFAPAPASVPNAELPKEKLPGPVVPALVAGWLKPVPWPKRDFPKPVAVVGVPNAVEPNPVGAGATGSADG